MLDKWAIKNPLYQRVLELAWPLLAFEMVAMGATEYVLQLIDIYNYYILTIIIYPQTYPQHEDVTKLFRAKANLWLRDLNFQYSYSAFMAR